MKPVCIDLFCGLGLSQSEFSLGADSPVEQFVAGRAEQPYHIGLSICHNPPRSVSLVARLVGYFEDSIFAAGLAGGRKVRIFSPESPEHRIFEGAIQIVGVPSFGVSAHPQLSEIACRISRAIFRAISLIGIWGCDVEVLAATGAITASLRNVGLFAPAAAPYAGLAAERAIPLIWPFSSKMPAAIGAN